MIIHAQVSLEYIIFSTIPTPWQYYTDSVHSELVGDACKFGSTKSILRASSVLPV